MPKLCSLLRTKCVWAEFWGQGALTHLLLQLIWSSWSPDGRRWRGQLEMCFLSLDPLADTSTPDRERDWGQKLSNWLYKRGFQTGGQCSSALFFVSSPACFQKCNANNHLPGSRSWPPVTPPPLPPVRNKLLLQWLLSYSSSLRHLWELFCIIDNLCIFLFHPFTLYF